MFISIWFKWSDNLFNTDVFVNKNKWSGKGKERERILAGLKWKHDLRLPVGYHLTGHVKLQRLVKSTFVQSRSAQHPHQYCKNKLETELALHSTAVMAGITLIGPTVHIEITWPVCKALFSHIPTCISMFVFHWD